MASTSRRSATTGWYRHPTARSPLANRRLGAGHAPDFDLADRDNLHEFALSYFFFAAIFRRLLVLQQLHPIFCLQRRD